MACTMKFLNQTHIWFLKIISIWTSACVRVCVPTPRTSGMMWTSHDWLNKGYSFYMKRTVVISDARGLGIEACCRYQSNKSKLPLYKLLLSI